MPTTLRTADLRIKRNDGSGYDSVVNILSSNPTAQQILSYMQPYYSQFINNTPTGVDKIIAAIAENYIPQTTYNIGDYCFYQGNLYKCISNNTTGDWHINKWDKVVVTDEIKAIKTSVEENADDIANLSSDNTANKQYIQQLQSNDVIDKVNLIGNWNDSQYSTVAGRVSKNKTDIESLNTQITSAESKIKNLQDTLLPEDYIQKEVDRVCKQIRNIQTINSITFIAVGGLYYQSGETSNKIDNMVYAINKISQQIHIDFYGSFGDLAAKYKVAEYSAAIQQIEKGTAALNKSFKNNPQFRLIGKTDVKRSRIYTPEGSSDEVIEVIPLNKLNSFTAIYNKNFIETTQEIGIGYHDFQKQKIRLIILNTAFYTQGNRPRYDSTYYANDIGYSQGTRLAEMLDLTTSKGEDAVNWNIFICSNWNLSRRGESQFWYRIIPCIFYFYNSGTKWDSSSSNNEYNFSGKNVAKIIGMFNHRNNNFLWNNLITKNAVGTKDDHVNTTILPYFELSIPSLTSGSTGTNGISYQKLGTTAVQTKDRTISFSIITLDTTNQKIYSHTYGAGPDMIIHYQPLEITQPTQLTTVLDGNVTWSSSHTEHLEEDLQNQGAAQVGAVPGTPQTATVTGMYQGYLTVWAQTPLDDNKNKIEIWNLKINSNQ